ncbi:MAG: DJ-1/PfpI family protein [Hyphomicrobiaceae bacterium]
MRNIQALVFENFQVLDLMGPLEFIGNLPDEFEIELVAEHAGPVTSHAGVGVLPTRALDDATVEADILLIPGGTGTRTGIGNTALIEWIAQAGERAGLVATVCTGAALLAATGLLDGRKATTNKCAFDWVSGTRAQVDWQKRSRWVEDGKYFTSSGVSAGMDMTLAIIARLLGRSRAGEVAMWAEYTWQSDPDHDPFALA